MPSSSLRIESDFVELAKLVSTAHYRSAAKQIEHWAKIGRMMKENPDVSYEFVRQALIAKALRYIRNWDDSDWLLVGEKY